MCHVPISSRLLRLRRIPCDLVRQQHFLSRGQTYKLDPVVTGRRHASTWRPMNDTLSLSDLAQFRSQAFEAERPALIPRGSADIDARGTWLENKDDPKALNIASLQKHGESLFLPMEMTVPGANMFHHTNSAPLSLFLKAIEDPLSTVSDAPRIYIAQCSLSRLPPDLAAPFATPPLVRAVGKGDVYDSSLWLGLPPTSTPLHRDPNPNWFAQIAGRKVVRLMSPEHGSGLYAKLRAMAQSTDSFGASERIRGEEMMKDEQKMLLEEAVWDGDGSEFDGEEASLEPGDALFIPKGWWHAVRGVGQGINMSVNWWFR